MEWLCHNICCFGQGKEAILKLQYTPDNSNLQGTDENGSS